MKFIPSIVLATFIAVACPGCRSQDVVTWEEYQQIDTGMSYTKVSEVIGDPGIRQWYETRTNSNSTGESVLWTNKDGSTVNCIFKNDTLVYKSETLKSDAAQNPPPPVTVIAE